MINQRVWSVIKMSTMIIGRLTADPEISFSNSGNAITRFTVAISLTKGGREQVSYFDCSSWGTLAKGVADSLHEGDRIIMEGRLVQEPYETTDGKSVTITVILADAVGPDLRFQTAVVSQNPRPVG